MENEATKPRKPKWQRILELEAQAKAIERGHLQAPSVKSSERAALERLVQEQKRTNTLLALQPFVMRPGRIIMGGIVLFIILKVWMS